MQIEVKRKRERDRAFMPPLLPARLAHGFAALTMFSPLGGRLSIWLLVVGHIAVCASFVDNELDAGAASAAAVLIILTVVLPVTMERLSGVTRYMR